MCFLRLSFPQLSPLFPPDFHFHPPSSQLRFSHFHFPFSFPLFTHSCNPSNTWNNTRIDLRENSHWIFMLDYELKTSRFSHISHEVTGCFLVYLFKEIFVNYCLIVTVISPYTRAFKIQIFNDFKTAS